MPLKVFIPAMEKRSALVAARSLGKRGVEVVGCSSQKRASGFFSKYCCREYVYCSPLLDVSQYLQDIKDIIDREKPDVFLPMNEETLLPILSERAYFEEKIKLPLPPNQALEIACDKLKSFNLARRLDIPCPRLIEDIFGNVPYPLIIRPSHSREVRDNRMVAKKLSYVFSPTDFSVPLRPGFFAQEYIPGQGYGFYALFDRGAPKAYFMLKRIHEVPFFGGPSSLRESICEDQLKEYGLRILEELNWHGVAMVEFRRDLRDNRYKFIEINPRLWGSLALPLRAGIDFPWLLLQLAQGKDIEERFNYQLGVKCRWLFGEVSYLKSIFFGKKVDKRPSRLKALLGFFKFFGKDLYYDYFQKDDLKPALAETWLSVKKFLKR